MHLSDVFKFTQGLGQKGHQIGRKVGDAIELLTLGMIHLDEELSKYLVIEDGVLGATTAEHKVEFSFYNLNLDQVPSRVSEELFGIIECKKVGVEQTIKQSFKKWKAVPQNRTQFHLTPGFTFSIYPNVEGINWSISVIAEQENGNNLKIRIRKTEAGNVIESVNRFYCSANNQVLLVLDVENELHLLGPDENLNQIERSILKCNVIEIESVSQDNITAINVNESLPGPQTPEKAKQASFVSLDVRKKVLGQFDKSENQSFVSILVIGEASHWEEKSRSMIRLCNDYNLIIPDNIIVYLFTKFEELFGENYQEKITKTNYKNITEVKEAVNQIIEHFEKKILKQMETGAYVTFGYELANNSNRLKIIPLENNP
jgi:hypothetical protein